MRHTRWWQTKLASGLLAALLLGAGCVGFGVDSYEEFRGAVEGGASCDELFDIREGLPTSVDRGNVDADLREIGCVSRGSQRTDE